MFKHVFILLITPVIATTLGFNENQERNEAKCIRINRIIYAPFKFIRSQIVFHTLFDSQININITPHK